MYLIHELAKLAGTTTRTLRYYDDIGLLKPAVIEDSGYRKYHQKQVDLLQQILIYKKLGFDLKQIKKMISDPAFNETKALKKHLESLYQEKYKLDQLIHTIEKSIASHEGEYQMKDEEKFDGLKQSDIDINEKIYGKEARVRFGNEKVDQANEKYLKQSETDYQDATKLAKLILETLKEALEKNDPKSDIAQHVCELHQTWLKYYWTSYDKKSHLALVHMYLEDERFNAYYEKVGIGATQLLVDAMEIYLSKH